LEPTLRDEATVRTKTHLVGLITLAISSASNPCHSQQQLLPPEQAFRIQSTQIDPNAVVFQFTMQPGYILYRDRFAFSGADIERVDLPDPESKFDPVLGKTVLFYRGTVNARVLLRPTTRRSVLVAAAQGCAQDIGVCYPQVSAVHRLP
jgi:thiol:disulfide interchange protein DsbD